jgi:Fructose-bisphosphate aldolase class-II
MASAARAERAVAAFNVITLEHAEGIVAGAGSAGQPVILQVSQNAVKFHGGAVEPLAAALREIAAAASVPVALHLDHVEDPQLIRRGIAARFSSAVMVDAVACPARRTWPRPSARRSGCTPTTRSPSPSGVHTPRARHGADRGDLARPEVIGRRPYSAYPSALPPRRRSHTL